MALEDSFAQVLYIEVGINLRRRKVFMSEQLLYDAQVGAVLQQVGSERVTQRVRTDGLGDAGFGA